MEYEYLVLVKSVCYVTCCGAPVLFLLLGRCTCSLDVELFYYDITAYIPKLFHSFKMIHDVTSNTVDSMELHGEMCYIS